MLDTSFFIDLRSRRDPGAVAVWSEIVAGRLTAAVSAIAIYELWVGSRISREEEAFYQACLAFLEEAPLLGSAAMTAGAWLRLARERTEPLFRDALIAATALERSERVLTRNVRDFSLFPAVEVETY
jgi:predicted nucleic acid-binding protein